MNQIIDTIIDLIETNITNKNLYEELEQTLHYSLRHIRRIFKNETDLNLKDYTFQRKMSNAYFDLKYNKQPIDLVSKKYGYSSKESFSRSFKNFYDNPPSRIYDIDVDMTIKRLTAKTIGPVIRNEEYRDAEINNYENFKDIYWITDYNGISSYLIDVNGFGKVTKNELIKYDFGDHYITDVKEDLVTSFKKTKDKFPLENLINRTFNNLNSDEVQKNICFITTSGDDYEVAKVLSEIILSKNAIPIILNEYKDYSNTIYTIVKFLNSTATYNLDYEMLYEFVSKKNPVTIYNDISIDEEMVNAVLNNYYKQNKDRESVILFKSKRKFNDLGEYMKNTFHSKTKFGFLIDHDISLKINMIFLQKLMI